MDSTFEPQPATARGASGGDLTTDLDRSRVLLEINNTIITRLNFDELLRAISGCLGRLVAHDFAALLLYDPEINQLRAHGLLPLDDAVKEAFGVDLGMTMPIDGTISGLAFKTRRAVLRHRFDLTEFYADIHKVTEARGARSGCAVPLISNGRTLGTLGVASVREGAFTEADAEMLTQVAQQVALAVDNALAYGEIERLKKKLTEEKLYLEDEIRTDYNFEEIVGKSTALREILRQVETVAPTDSTVLIRGETGTGKELIARAIHDLSGRRQRTLVKVNCAAIPMGLIESELFGHEKGAFTGAISQRVGRFELADRGTLFLDEVGDIPLELQPKLLRVLQEQQFERLGSPRTQQVDVRLVAATNCSLEQMVADKQYRRDLYYRLNVFPITIPPLRERQEDIPLLVRFFTHRFAQRMKKRIETISAKTYAALARYHWPGNVRELENVIERAVILSRGSELQIPLNDLKAAPDDVIPGASVNEATLESVERDYILRVLESCKWVVAGPNGAAERLGMKRTTLQGKMHKLGISRRG